MKRTYQINYHVLEYSERINRCWGNSLHVLVDATNLIRAIRSFHSKYPIKNGYKIYNIEAYNPTVELSYDATQALLKFEGIV